MQNPELKLSPQKNAICGKTHSGVHACPPRSKGRQNYSWLSPGIFSSLTEKNSNFWTPPKTPPCSPGAASDPAHSPRVNPKPGTPRSETAELVRGRAERVSPQTQIPAGFSAALPNSRLFLYVLFLPSCSLFRSKSAPVGERKPLWDPPCLR